MVDRTRRVVRVVGLTAVAVPATVWWLTPPDEFTRAMAAVIIWVSGAVYGALLTSRGGRS
jgi:predicted CDP-diglyceride synthetase/phosphatidate cytidylyltransferase